MHDTMFPPISPVPPFPLVAHRSLSRFTVRGSRLTFHCSICRQTTTPSIRYEILEEVYGKNYVGTLEFLMSARVAQ